jgi:hypothetical protein
VYDPNEDQKEMHEEIKRKQNKEEIDVCVNKLRNFKKKLIEEYIGIQ